jgi:hypothetical protein
MHKLAGKNPEPPNLQPSRFLSGLQNFVQLHDPSLFEYFHYTHLLSPFYTPLPALVGF